MRCKSCDTMYNGADDELCLTCLGAIKYYDEQPEAERSCTRWDGWSLTDELGIMIDEQNGSMDN